LAESESKFMLKLFEGGKITKLGSQAAGWWRLENKLRR
jgi:hypothetical protein